MEESQTGRLAGSVVVAVLALVLAALLSDTASALAEGNSWARFAGQAAEVQFGSSVAFSLSADSAREVAKVWLVYRLEGERARNRAAAEFGGGSSVQAQYTWRLEPGSLAPGVTVYYHWELETSDGERTASPESSFSYEDDRFAWQVLSDGDLSVYFYRDQAKAAQVLEAGSAALERIAEGTGMRPVRPIRLYVYASRRDMSLAIPSRSETFDSRTVTLGMSMGSDALVLLGADGDLLQTTAHELCHAVIHQATDSPFANLPRWLDEGLAMYSEGELPSDNLRALTQGIREGKLISLRSMTSYPGDAALVDLFYGEAYSIVAYMIEEYGSASMQALLAELAAGTPVSSAMAEAYGFGLDELEARWLASLGVEVEPAAVSAGSV